uniref:Uncharacterized protein n=1 Tax=Lygus hesperus TaxID=30085 RepID=A0A0A9WHI2_LYGHE
MSGKLAELLRSSKMFHWETVDFGSYESVVNWFVMSYDPRVVLNLEQEEGHVDQSVMELLRYAAGFAHSLPGYHSSTPRKRQVFVRAYVKLIISCLSKYKAIAVSHQPKVESAIEDVLVLINTVVPQTGGNFAEAGLLVSEVLTLVNLTGGPASKIGTETLVSWLSKRGDCIVAAALLRTVGTTVEQTSLIGEIMESVFQSVFNDQSGGDWDKTLNHLQEPIPRNPPIENHLVENCQLLTLYAFLNKRLSTLFDLSEEMDIFTSLTKLISSMQPMVEKSEKIIPLFHLCLIMAARLSDSNPIVCDKNLRNLVQSADAWAEYKPSWGFLGAIGLKRQHSLSPRMKAICKTLCALILIQLPENKSDLPCDNNVPFIRTTPQSPGGFTSNSTELGPSNESHKALSQLEAFINDKSYSEIRQALEISLGFIRRTENSMHNAHQLFLRVSKMLFPEIRFIQAITLGT